MGDGQRRQNVVHASSRGGDILRFDRLESVGQKNYAIHLILHRLPLI
jgi:hypothetical protein